MNAPVLLAQLSGSSSQSSAAPKSLKIAKPQSGQAVTIHLDGAAKIDFSQISSEKLTFVRLGDRLIILFDNQSTLSIDPVFNNAGAPLPDVSFEMAPGRVLNGTEFAELFPITTDQSVLPAAGTPGAPASPSGANFGSFTIDALAGGTPLSLLSGEAPGSQQLAPGQTTTSTPIPGGAVSVVVDEDGLPGGLPGGFGDTAGVATSLTGSLNVDFGSDFVGRSFAFAATQPGLTGLSSGGQPISIQITTVNGQPVLIGYTGADPSVAANQVFVVSLDAATTVAGSYTVTLLRPLDHPVGGTEDTLNLTIDIIATDGSGDSAPLSIVIGVNDDSPVAATVAATTLMEQTGEGNVFVSSSVTAALGISWGADSGNSNVDGGVNGAAVLGDRSLVFAGSAVTSLAALGLTSNGETISYTLSADGTSILATAGDGRAVFTVTLSDAGDGSYTFTLLDNLDHVGASGATQPLTFAVVATDADGDPVGSSFTVNITDDVPVANPGTSSAVADEALPGGNDQEGGPTASVTGVSLNIEWHSDDANANAGQPGNRAVAFTNADVTISGAYGDTLTSLGQAVRFTVLATGELVGYTGEAVPTSTNSFNVVLFASLSDAGNGSYSLTLVKPLDHAAGAGENTLSLTFNYTATDSDGDTSSNAFTVNVVDDVPVASAGDISTVGDESLPGGNSGEDEGGVTAMVDGVSLNIAWGADNGNDGDGQPGDRSVAFSNADVTVTGAYGEALTSLGLRVQFALLSDGTLVGYTGESVPTSTSGGNVVLFATVSDVNNGEYSFTLVKPLDHAAGSGENTLSLTFNYTATDSDGDSASNTFTVDIVDDVPVIGTPDQTGTVEEEQPIVVGAGNEDFGGAGDADTGYSVLGVPVITRDNTTQTTSGTLAISWGADSANDANGQPGDRSVAFTAEGLTTLRDQHLTSRGDEIHYKVFTVNGGEVLVAYTGSVEPSTVPANTGAAIAAHVVFTVSLSDAGAGSYKFTLVDTIDHPGEVQGEESLALQFQFTATDSDGDTTAPASFGVKVIDDTPVAIGTILTRVVEEEQLAGGNEDTSGAGDGDFNLFGFVDVTTASAGGPLNIFWGGDDSNVAVNGGYNGTQLAGDRSVVFGGAGGAHVVDGVISAAVAAQFVAVSGGAGAVSLANLTSGGESLIYTLSQNGTVLTATTAGSAQTVFTVTLSDQGTGGYNFTLNGVLDHPVSGNSAAQEDKLAFTFTFTARDGDGDIARSSFTVNVIDDAPVAKAGTTSTVEDESLPGGNNEADGYAASVSHVSLNIAWGADNANDNNDQPGDRSVAFTNANVTVVGAYGSTLTSLGQEVHFALIGDSTLVGYTGATAPSSTSAGNVVFYAKLSDINNGEYDFTLVKSLDHSAGGSENTLSLTFNYTATDSDGDTSSNIFTVRVIDDVPLIGSPYQGGVVEEEQPIVVGAGNEDGSGTGDGDVTILGNVLVDNTTQTTGGTLAISWGADNANDGNGQPGDRSVAFTQAGIASLVSQHLTSRGEELHYKAFTVAGGEVLVAYTGLVEPTSVPANTNAAIAAHVVFTVSLSDADAGSYKFTLVDTLDHSGAVQGEDSLALQFQFTATDSDGDTSAPSSFMVKVIDDTPIAIGTIFTRTVEEEQLPGGNEDTSGLGDGDYVLFGFSDVTTAAATGPLNILWGGDDSNTGIDAGYNGTQIAGDRSVVFGGAGGAHIADGMISAAAAAQFVTVFGGNGPISVAGLTSGGEQLIYTLSGNGTVLTATTSSNQAVFTVTLSDQGAGGYTFELNGPLDHPLRGSGSWQEDTISFTFTFTVRDGDGDIARDNFTVNVIDDSPVAAGGNTSRVEDESLPGGNNEADGLTASVSGVSLNISWGADDANSGTGQPGDRAVAFTNANVGVSGDYGAQLTSLGQVVNFKVLATGELVGYTGGPVPTSTSASNVVFYVSLSDANSGSYDFTLKKPLDHASGNGENTLGLTFNYTATDSDGDTSSSTFKVNVVDDVPVAGTGTTATVEDESLAGGNNEADGLAASVTGVSLNIAWGADNGNDGNGQPGDRSVRFSNANVSVSGDYGSSLTSLGQEVRFKVLSSGELVGYTGSTAPTSTSSPNVVLFAKLSDLNNGEYAFTLVKPLDHAAGNGENTLALTFNYTATDSDGDSSSNTFTVNVVDDVPVIGSIASQTVTEVTSSSPGNAFQAQSLSGVSLNIGWGSDNANPTAGAGTNDRSVAFDPSLANSVPSVTSNGIHLIYLLSADGQTLTAYRYENGHYLTGSGGDLGTSPSDSARVFTASLSDSGNGSYSFTLYDNLDHPTGAAANTLPLMFGFSVTDSDGDVASSSFTVNVKDDVPLSIGTPDVGAVTEVGLANAVSYTTGSLKIDWNADDFGSRHLEFVKSGGNPVITAGLTSDGVPLVYVLRTAANGVDQELVAFKTGDAQVDSNAVFIVSLNSPSNPTYIFTLFQNLDHTGPNGTTLPITFQVRGVDGDGDSVDQTVTVKVADDTPTLTQTYRYNDVYEAQLSGGPDVDGRTFAVQFGADGYGATAFTGAIKLDIGPGLAGNVGFDVSGGAHREPLLTSEGRAITFVKVDDNTIRGYVASADNGGNGDVTILEIKLTDTDASATTTLYGSIDHIAVQDGSQITSIRVDATVAFSDGDGDVVTGIIRTTIHDDAPVSTGAITAATVLDDDVFAGNAGGAGDVPDAATATGAAGALFAIGADGLKNVVLDATTAFSAIYTDGNGVSHTEQVTWGNPAVVGGATTWIASGAHGDAARLTINADGSYTFTALKPLAHPTPGTTEETLTLTFNYTVTDRDNDTAAGSLTVKVNDDTPTLTQTYRYNDVYESQLSGGSDVNGHSFAVQFGADGYGATAFTGAIKLDIGPGLAGNVSFDVSGGAHREPLLTSEGRAITFVKVDDNTIRGYVASADNGGNGDETILEIKLTDTDTSATTTLYGVLDHVAAQDGSQIPSIRVDATVAFSDGDGDVVTGIIRTTINDDLPTVRAIAEQSVIEVTASGFSNAFQAQSLSNVSLNISWGADDANPTAGAGAHDRSIAFDPALGGMVPAFTSNGIDLIYRLSADGQTLTAYRYEGGHYLNGGGYDLGTSPSNLARVFAVSLSDSGSGSYSFTLYDNLDQPAGQGSNSLPLTFGFTVTDSDSDTASGSFTVQVQDDVPQVTGTADSGSVAEALLASGVQSTFGYLNIDWNADDTKAHLTFTNTAITDGSGNTLLLTSGGAVLKYAIVAADGSTNPLDQKLVAYKDGDTPDHPVFTVNLIGSNASYQFVLYQPLDHTPAHDSSMPLTFGITGYDGDGDAVTQSITVNVADGDAQSADIDAVTIEEAAGSVSTGPVDLRIDYGADGQSAGPSVTFFTAAPTHVLDQNGNAVSLSSLGVGLTYVLSADGTTLTAYRFNGTSYVGQNGASLGSNIANAADAQVFTVALSDAGTGAYTFTLLQPLDHPTATGSTQQLSLNFSFQIEDGDGDKGFVNNFTVIVDAAGAVSSGYTAPNSAVFVNMSDTAQTYDGQTVAAHTVTDRASVSDRVVGLDRLGTLSMADGGNGDDILIGGAGNNKLFGHDGNDILIGGGGFNTLQGGAGNDTIIYTVGSGGTDTVDGGADTDTQIIDGTGSAETFNINAIGLNGSSYLGANIDTTSTAASSSNFEVATKAVEEWVVNGGGGGDSFNVSGPLLGTGLAASTLTINGEAGNDTTDLTGFAYDVRIVSDGGADTDTVKFAFNFADASYARVYAPDGQTVIGAQVTYNGLTNVFTNYENFVFADGTRTLQDVVNSAPVFTSTSSGSVTEDFSSTIPLTERVTNGSFEGPTNAARLSGWTTSNVTSLGEPHSGSNAVGVYLGTGSLGQTFQTVAGVTYNIRFWASNPFDTAGEVESLNVLWGGQTVMAQGNIPASGGYSNFTLYSINVVATGPSTALTIEMQDTKGWWVLDDVSVKAVVTPGIETAQGTLSFTDADIGNVHQVSYTPAASGYYGTFTPVITDSATADGVGTISWTYAVSDADIQQLALGETITQTYVVTVDDGHGGVTSQNVDVLLHGTNDAPVAKADTVTMTLVGTAPGTATSTPVFNEAETNNNFPQANVIDRSLLKVAPNANLTDASDPSITVKGSINDNSKDYFAITLKAGETLVLDIDNTSFNLDTTLRIFSQGGTQLGYNDDSSKSTGGGGSTDSNGDVDSYLTYTATVDGTYYIEVGRFGSSSSNTGSYELQVSIDNMKWYTASPLTVSAATLLANDSDIDHNDTFTLVSVSGQGVALVNGDVVVQPGVTSFSYTIRDSHGAESTATVQVNQIVVPPNSAPVLSGSGFALGSEAEDAGPPTGAVGTRVADLVDLPGNGGHNNVTDANTGAVTGIALTATNTANGIWWFSLDNGASWTQVGSVSNTQALLLAESARLYFQPNADWNGTVSQAISYRAWDQTSGLEGAKVDTSVNGGTSAFSTQQVDSDLTVTAVNDAPLNTVPGAQSVNEDVGKAITGLSISDVDAGNGVLSTTLAVTHGTLTVAAFGGATVGGSGTDLVTISGTVAQINATLAAANNVVYQGALNFNGTDTLTMTTNDGGNAGAGGAKSDTDTVSIVVNPVNDLPVAVADDGGANAAFRMTEDAGTATFNVLANDTLDPDAGATNTVTIASLLVPTNSYGIDASDLQVTVTGDNKIQVTLLGTDWNKLGNGAFLTIPISYTLHGDGVDASTATLSLRVTGVNDAPVLDATKTPAITENQNAGAPVGGLTTGTLVSDLANLQGGGGLDNISDVDGFVAGMAITGVNSSHGTWYWSPNGGANWISINPNSVSATHALLLDGAYSLYFAPAANYTGTIADALTFQAWDRSSGTTGSYVDATLNGGATALSAASDTVAVNIADVTPPTVLSVTMSDTALKIGDTSVVTITFSEAVTGFDNNDVTVENGTLGQLTSSDGGITWTGNFVPTTNITDTTNVITVAPTYTDLASNAGSGKTSGNYTVDTLAPTVASVTMSDTALTAGETSTVTITFSEAVTNFDNTDVTVQNGALGPLSSSNGGLTWVGTFTPTTNINDSTNVITVAGTYTDLAGNAGSGGSSGNYTINTVANHAPVAVDDVLLAASSGPAAGTPGVFSYNGHVYQFVGGAGDNFTWTEADALAKAAGGYLVTITSAGENQFVTSHVNFLSTYGAWIGASDAGHEGAFTWTGGPESGQAISYAPWEQGEPNNGGIYAPDEDYVQIYKNWLGNGTWNDAPNSGGGDTWGYVIEWGGLPAGAQEDTPYTISAATLLANDTDQDGDTLSIVSVQGALHGTVALNGTTITFTPTANYNGPASFTYTVSDGHGGTSTATASFTIGSVSDAPTGTSSTVTMTEDVTRVFTLADFGYSDGDGDAMSGVTITSLTANNSVGKLLYGNAAVTVGQFISAADIAAGMLNFAPTDDAFRSNLGTVQFGFKVKDSTGASDATADTITIGFGNANRSDYTSYASDSTVDVYENTGAPMSFKDAGGTDNLRIANATFATLTSLGFLRSDDNLEIGWASSSSNGYATVLDQYVGGNKFENFLFQNNANYGGFGITGLYTLAQGLNNSSGSTNSIIAGTEASDTMSGGSAKDMMFGNGGHDTLYGNAGNDLLVGGLGNDRLEGGANDDTYLFGLADGKDTIYDESGTGDRIVIKTNGAELTGLNAYDTDTYAYSGDLMIQFNGQSIDVEAHYDGFGNAVNLINFDNGTVYGYTLGTLDYAVNNADPFMDGNGFRTVTVSGGDNFIAGEISAANKITGGSGADLIFGGDLADTLDGGGGNNLIVGGKGNDTLSAGSGNDVYAFGLTDGNDTITDYAGAADAIFIDSNGAALSGLVAYDDNNGTNTGNLVIQYNGQQITVNDHFTSSNRVIERISFDDGSVDGYDLDTTVYTVRANDPNESGGFRTVNLSSSSSDNLIAGENGTANAITGGDGKDLIFGGGQNDILSGGAGSDYLRGGGGNDILAGGADHDTLRGGSGSDTFKFAESGASNFDTIIDYSSAEGDTLDLSALLDAAYGPGNNVDADFVRLVNSGADVKVQVDLNGVTGGQNWADVAVLQGYHTAGNTVLAQFENATHSLTVAA
ncbi:T1SS-143 repeat domain-containing protein [Rhodopseudomonas telluris]|uniref:Ig-like domain-containing protein n=1 Tax=Rhodopseudomonas telluris TaxID=644215 RepID=A0ABV6EZW5_9BRAD